MSATLAHFNKHSQKKLISSSFCSIFPKRTVIKFLFGNIEKTKIKILQLLCTEMSSSWLMPNGKIKKKENEKKEDTAVFLIEL